ncbi:type II/IV secretion system protein [Planctomycetota bacterium]|nr:type II/IV secretion system protein [Planctomycetota bacterium]
MTQIDQTIEGQLAHVWQRDGILTEVQANELLRCHKANGKPLEVLAGELGFADSGQIIGSLVEVYGVEVVDLEKVKPETNALELVGADLAYKHKLMPLEVDGGRLLIAMANPFDGEALKAARIESGRRISVCYARELELFEAIERAYGSNVARMIADLRGSESNGSADDDEVISRASVVELQEMAREPSVVNLVNLILLEAVEANASDVHIEPFEKKIYLKYRIDGALQNFPPPPAHLCAAIVSRIKIMADMNIAERFVPQDGHIRFKTAQDKVDIRVSTVPTVFGESVVMRILNRSLGLIELEHLGLSGAKLGTFEHAIEKPHGIVLVTGPTGSGKTTTLYAALNKVFSPEKKIITIEEPVEYQLDGINQIPVNHKRGVDFATGLRAILRQDPDVIMVGEIRDNETADIAIRSALTGHMVFSTLHTNNAAGAVTRLLDMQVEPYLLASSLETVLAQRLVRRICKHCRAEVEPDGGLIDRMGVSSTAYSGVQFYKGQGCKYCRDTGYSGRQGIYELLPVTEEIRHAIMHQASAAEIMKHAPTGHEVMRMDGFHKACRGETTLEEILRVTQDSEM